MDIKDDAARQFNFSLITTEMNHLWPLEYCSLRSDSTLDERKITSHVVATTAAFETWRALECTERKTFNQNSLEAFSRRQKNILSLSCGTYITDVELKYFILWRRRCRCHKLTPIVVLGSHFSSPNISVYQSSQDTCIITFVIHPVVQWTDHLVVNSGLQVLISRQLLITSSEDRG